MNNPSDTVAEAMVVADVVGVMAVVAVVAVGDPTEMIEAATDRDAVQGDDIK
jgi:hypothetical protein